MKPSDVLNKIIYLYEHYSTEHRGSTQPFHLQKIQQLVKGYHYDVNDKLIREPLIEHSGSLPIVATTVYPFIKDPSVDLGKALIMLAIHDIGELITGDEITFIKNQNKVGHEQAEALKLLPEIYHDIYNEAEGRTSNTARFAKAIDKMTPDIVDLMTPAEITVQRYKLLIKKDPQEIVSTIKEYKHPYMLWNEFMTNLHLEILKRIDEKIKPYCLND